LRILPLWLGVTGTVIAMAAMALFDARVLFDGAVPTNHVAVHEPMQWGLRSAFLLIAVGALWRLRSPLAWPWRWAVGGASVMLVCGVVGEVTGALVRLGWILDFGAGLGAADSLERRLTRLAAMAAYAVPMLVLLAACEAKTGAHEVDGGSSARLVALLVRWEPWLFTIGATTLATILMAGAFVNKELTWLAPIGADTTVAACAAAAIRARWRGDGLAFGGWLAVCSGMAIGLLMGSYSFEGPLGTPIFIGDYNALPRMLLRDGHVIVMSMGIAGIAMGITRSRYKVRYEH
jgi:hypothetical protein